MRNPSQSYRASLAILDHTMLPATRHKWTCSALTPAKQAGTRFTYPGRMEGWVDLGSLIAARPGIEPTTAWSQVRRPNRYDTKVIDQTTFRRGITLSPHVSCYWSVLLGARWNFLTVSYRHEVCDITRRAWSRLTLTRRSRTNAERVAACRVVRYGSACTLWHHPTHRYKPQTTPAYL